MNNSILNFSEIRKRDGRVVSFSPEKITQALLKAAHATQEFDAPVAEQLTRQVIQMAQGQLPHTLPTVEQIQDVVEAVLLASPYRATAKAYIIYREQHARLREIAQQSHVNLMGQYLDKLDWQVRENSNMSFSLQGLNNYVSSELTKTYWLQQIYPAAVREAHQSGALHMHDLNSLSVYCVGWDLMDLLLKGFRGVSGKVASRPAKHFSSILGQIVNFFYTLQGEAAGAQAFSNMDTLLAPFIRYDGLSYAQVRQAIQEFVFNLNVPTRVGFQSPFTNLTFDLTPSLLYAHQPVIIGGEPQNETYGEFQPEMDMLNRAFWDVMMQGDADGRVFTFPIPTYNVTEAFDWDDPAKEGLWEMTARYGVPYFANFINSDMDPEDARSMCCRLRLDQRELKRRGGGLFGANAMTGSIGVVTLNMPRLGYLAKTPADFFNQLGNLMDVARDSLEIKRKILERFTDQGLYPYVKFYLSAMAERFGRYWDNHFSTIGLLGLNECCLNLLGDTIASPQGHAFAQETLHFMRERLQQYQEDTGHLYNLEATPAEGTSYRLARLDRVLYPDIQCAFNANGQQEVPFYSNSSQLPVGHTEDVLAALDHQEALQTAYTGGTVFHAFLGEQPDDTQQIKRLVRAICHQYRIPYLTMTPTFSICSQHGYLKGEQPHCPQCAQETEVYSRVVGYLRPVSHWNEGKQAEFEERQTYAVPMPAEVLML